MNQDYERRVNLCIIGNGFDLHHCLLTSYRDFKLFLMKKNCELVELIDSIILERGFDVESVENWSKLEQFLAEFPNMDFDNFRERAFDGAEDDIERASYRDSPQYNAKMESSKICNLMKSVKDAFADWINSICLDSVKRDVSLVFPNEAYFLNFNYTNTLERVYKIPRDRVLHIHNQKNEYVLGHNQEKEIPYPNTENDYDIRDVEVKETLNDAYESVYNTYFKNSKQLLRDNSAWLSCVSDAIEIVFMGLSMGNEDFPYLDFIARKAKKCDKIKAYYHTEEDLVRMSVILDCKFPKVKADFVKW